jgi:hypothetical protein
MPKSTEQLTMEKLLSLLVREWQLSRTSPMGKPFSGVQIQGNETSIALTPLTMYEKGCPPNFGAFYDTAKFLNGMKSRVDAFHWYTRSRLYYSCSTLCVTFVEFVVPELKRRGIQEVKVSSLSNCTRNVSLDKIRVKSVFYTPKDGKVHAFRFIYLFGEKKDVIEMFGSHNNLECSETGMIFDPSLGQLSGQMKPAIFSSQNSFKTEFVGEVTHYFDAREREIQEQKQRDIDSAAMSKKSASHPKRVAKRVVDMFLMEGSDAEANSMYCTNCLGVSADGKKLLRCAKCKKMYYCSKDCQILDWKCHKLLCQDN